MKKVLIYRLVVIFLILGSSLFSTAFLIQDEGKDYYSDNYLRYEDHIYKKSIKTVQFRVKGFEQSVPIISLNDTKQLLLSFDELEKEVKEFSYKIIHCTADWQPSDLQPYEYVNGFEEDQITDYQYSFNTLQSYTHYELHFPNNQMQPTKSGNYLILIYEDLDEEQIVLTRRFMVFDQSVIIKPSIRRGYKKKNQPETHEIDFDIFHKNYDINNPYTDLKVYITKNSNLNYRITGLKPVFVHEGKLVYQHSNINAFKAGNELRRFDIRSFRFLTESVGKNEIEEGHNHVYLYLDEYRNTHLFKSHKSDLNGHFHIDVQEGRNKNVEADYAFVHFTLKANTAYKDGNVYVTGGFSNWNMSQEYQMTYFEEEYTFEATLYLKQGYYNYEYVYVKDENTKPDDTLIEGSYFKTENDYTVYVYHRKWGSLYDELIGVHFVNSGAFVF